LEQEVARVAPSGRKARILNLGCGPAGEIQTFLTRTDLSDHADFLLLDFNDETLDYAKRVLESLKQRHHRGTIINFEKRSVHQILKESSRSAELPVSHRYDLIYCAGLFDYLSDRVCKRLMDYFYDQLAPGGLLVATNVDSSNPNRNSMDFILEWHLTYRDKAELARLAPTMAPAEQCCVKADPTHVNIFLEVRKPYA
ncbi:MAG: class I SAM-dependent methyltransferase, partial [Verrucomicrobiae bacterium]|nr:class I SAM-dependent methyltransferase [Verrucomicrobiae bacterium]